MQIGLQLFTLRDRLAEDYAGTVRKVAEIGYAGVETGTQFPLPMEEVQQLYHDLGLQACAFHSGLLNDENSNEVLDVVEAFNCKNLVISWLPEEEFQTREGIQRLANQLNATSAITRRRDITLHFHNHWWELRPQFDGRTPLHLLTEYLDPEVQFEIDVYWVQTGGSNPAEIVRELGKRAPLLHIKDGPAHVKPPMTAVGEGVVDIPAVVAAAQADWLIVELDRCATDMMEAVQKSYVYLHTLLRQS
jgi:sugar phosphate isomerase/epimerase